MSALTVPCHSSTRCVDTFKGNVRLTASELANEAEIFADFGQSRVTKFLRFQSRNRSGKWSAVKLDPFHKGLGANSPLRPLFMLKREKMANANFARDEN